MILFNLDRFEDKSFCFRSLLGCKMSQSFPYLGNIPTSVYSCLNPVVPVRQISLSVIHLMIFNTGVQVLEMNDSFL